MNKIQGWKSGKVIGISCGLVLAGIIGIGSMYGWKMVQNAEKQKAAMKLVERNNYTTQLFGENVYIFGPEDDEKEIQKILDQLWSEQETNQFGEERYAVYFLPGNYQETEVNVGYYMQIAGLGLLPTDTQIPTLNCTATWLGDDESNHNACCNFWRGVENITINSNTMWAVSQATFMRRVNIQGSLRLHDNNGWASGGFLADSKIENIVDSGSQQQWLSRNCNWKKWMGQNWNMVFVGTEEGKAPTGTWPGTKYTTVEETPEIREKPFVFYDEASGYQVFVPNLRKEAAGVSWENGQEGKILSMDDFYVAKADTDTAESINTALKNGKNLILTPGIYQLDEALKVENPDTIVLGMGLATLVPTGQNACMEVADESGIVIAGILFDAGAFETECLLRVGNENGIEKTPISLSDLFFRVGGVSGYIATTKNCVEINGNNVIGDNFWVWRADHGDGVAWNQNTAQNGIIVNGDDVTVYALMVEHFQEYQTIWNGENGRVYFYQSEIPYDVPEQGVWMSHDNSVNGYASYKVGDQVKSHEAWGIGIYSYHRDAKVELFSAMEVPNTEQVKIHNICAIMITGNPGISHIINDQGEACLKGGDRKIIVEYQAGILK